MRGTDYLLYARFAYVGIVQCCFINITMAQLGVVSWKDQYFLPTIGHNSKQKVDVAISQADFATLLVERIND